MFIHQVTSCIHIETFTILAIQGAGDIVILLDISTQFIPDSTFKSKIIKFAQDYVKSFKGESGKRFGFVTYDTLADIQLQLSDYKNTDQVSNLISSIETKASSKRASAGLMKVRFEQDFKDESKKLVLVLTNGFSASKFGFLLSFQFLSYSVLNFD